MTPTLSLPLPLIDGITAHTCFAVRINAARVGIVSARNNVKLSVWA
jgi:hypothetical protein